MEKSEKSSNRHSKTTIKCCICGELYTAETRTIKSRFEKYGENYCKKHTPVNYTMTKKHEEFLQKLPHKKAEPYKTYTIQKPDELQDKRCLDKICYNCELCNKAVIRKCVDVRKTYLRFNKLICQECAKKNTVITPEDRQRATETRRKNNMEKYGVKNTSELPEVKAKISKKNKGRKIDWKKRNEKTRRTVIKKYGGLRNFYKMQEKTREENNKEIYGVKSTFEAEFVKDKIRENSIEKYGVTAPGNNKNARVLSSAHGNMTCYHKYGTSNYGKTEMQRKFMHDIPRYRYDEIEFGSKWALCFYIYYKEYNKDIKVCNKKFPYINEKGKSLIYQPDFEMDGKLYDIRGDSYYYGGEKYEAFEKSALFRCIKDNGVKVITLDEIGMYYEYIKWRYGNINWIDQFKIK